MKLSKKSLSIVIAYSIVTVIFIILTLVIPFDKPGASWVMFAFSIVSLVAGAFITIYAFEKPKELMSKFYGFPIFRIGFLYTCVQLFATVIIYIVGAYVDAPAWIGVLISLLFAGTAAVGCIITDNSRDVVEEIAVKEVISTKAVTTFKIDIGDILDMCKDPTVKEKLNELANRIKYSDPVSIDETKEIESQIIAELDILKRMVANNDSSAALEEIGNVTNLVNSRNRRCSAYK